VAEFLYDPRNRVEWEEGLQCVVPVARHGDDAYTIYRRYTYVLSRLSLYRPPFDSLV
jgi:hypothetical protein